MKYILLIVSLLIVLTVYFVILKPDPVYEVGTPAPSEADDTEAVDTVPMEETTAEKAAAEARRAEMHALYDRLEKARRNLERRLSRLKALLWDIELPREEGERIQARMKNAYGLLKNRKMLGAFGSVEALRDELTRVEFAYRELEPVERMAREKEEQGDRPGDRF